MLIVPQRITNNYSKRILFYFISFLYTLINYWEITLQAQLSLCCCTVNKNKKIPENNQFRNCFQKGLILQEFYKKVLSFVNLTEISYLVRPRQKKGYIVKIWQKNGYLVRICQKPLAEDASSCKKLPESARLLLNNPSFLTRNPSFFFKSCLIHFDFLCICLGIDSEIKLNRLGID